MRRLAYAPAAGSWKWVLASGVLLVAAGGAALIAPSLTTVAAGVLIGWLLLVVGVAGVAMGVRTLRHHGRWGDLLYGAASVLVGAAIIVDPWAGAMSLTLALAIWFAIRGGIELGGAWRAGPGRARIVLAAIGAVDLLLAAVLIAYYPFPAVRAVGLFIAASFLMAGAVTIATAVQLRAIAHV